MFTLPKLKFGFKDLQPYISEEQLKVHYEKHHQSYVNNANNLLQKIDNARKDNSDLDMKAVLKDLSFNISGHLLHSLFWSNLGKNKLGEKILEKIDKEFGSFERFKKEFSQAALSAEGSGWAVLAQNGDELIIMQIEKHNVNVIPGLNILLVLDVFEHAYYIDYKNDRAKFIENFWNIIDWNEVNKRLR